MLLLLAGAAGFVMVMGCLGFPSYPTGCWHSHGVEFICALLSSISVQEAHLGCTLERVNRHLGICYSLEKRLPVSIEAPVWVNVNSEVSSLDSPLSTVNG